MKRFLLNWFRTVCGTATRPAMRAEGRRTRPQIEALETREVPTVALANLVGLFDGARLLQDVGKAATTTPLTAATVLEVGSFKFACDAYSGDAAAAKTDLIVVATQTVSLAKTSPTDGFFSNPALVQSVLNDFQACCNDLGNLTTSAAPPSSTGGTLTSGNITIDQTAGTVTVGGTVVTPTNAWVALQKLFNPQPHA